VESDWEKTVATYVPPINLLLDCAPNLGPLVSRWEIKKIENCGCKSVRILEVLKLLFQQFLNSSSSQRDMSGPILGDLSNNRWSGGSWKIQRKNSIYDWMCGCECENLTSRQVKSTRRPPAVTSRRIDCCRGRWSLLLRRCWGRVYWVSRRFLSNKLTKRVAYCTIKSWRLIDFLSISPGSTGPLCQRTRGVSQHAHYFAYFLSLFFVLIHYHAQNVQGVQSVIAGFILLLFES
jgi:hypothetical protein